MSSSFPILHCYSEAYVEKLHAKAFRDLEGEVCDLERMGQIAQDLIVQCVAKEDGYRDLEPAGFAVCQLAKMTRDSRRVTTSAGTVSWRACHEAPAPIGQKAQPVTDRQPRQTAQAVTRSSKKLRRRARNIVSRRRLLPGP
jgi:hypothetical protein